MKTKSKRKTAQLWVKTSPHYKAELITTNEHMMAAAFTEWDRRYREDPEKFMNEAKRLLKWTPKTYGDSAAPYFIKLLKELSATK